MIVISGELIQKSAECLGANDISFSSLDEGDVYSSLTRLGSAFDSVPGTIYVTAGNENVQFSAIGKASDKVRIIVDTSIKAVRDSSVFHPVTVTGFVRSETGWMKTSVQILPGRGEIFSRLNGILETSVLSGKKVFFAGLGSVGSTIAVELSKSGVDHFLGMDHDRIEMGNVTRHEAGLTDVGRYKTNVVAEKIHEKNPYAKVEMWKEEIRPENIELVQENVRKSDLVICATDNRPSKLILNRLIVEESKPCIFAGLFRRAYGGQILSVQPRVSPCYQCFLMYLPEQDQDQEVSSREQADELSYTDRPVPVEPGLSIDIAPVSTMAAKLAIQELLKGTETTLASLNDDLVAPLFFWLNRRESGTQYEKLKPLKFNVSGMHVLRWYGFPMERVTACPVCGEAGDSVLESYGYILR